jgi:hypothetical protein
VRVSTAGADGTAAGNHLLRHRSVAAIPVSGWQRPADKVIPYVSFRHEAEIEPLKLGAYNPPLEIWCPRKFGFSKPAIPHWVLSAHNSPSGFSKPAAELNPVFAQLSSTKRPLALTPTGQRTVELSPQ